MCFHKCHRVNTAAVGTENNVYLFQLRVLVSNLRSSFLGTKVILIHRQFNMLQVCLA